METTAYWEYVAQPDSLSSFEHVCDGEALLSYLAGPVRVEEDSLVDSLVAHVDIVHCPVGPVLKDDPLVAHVPRAGLESAEDDSLVRPDDSLVAPDVRPEDDSLVAQVARGGPVRFVEDSLDDPLVAHVDVVHSPVGQVLKDDPFVALVPRAGLVCEDDSLVRPDDSLVAPVDTAAVVGIDGATIFFEGGEASNLRTAPIDTAYPCGRGPERFLSCSSCMARVGCGGPSRVYPSISREFPSAASVVQNVVSLGIDGTAHVACEGTVYLDDSLVRPEDDSLVAHADAVHRPCRGVRFVWTAPCIQQRRGAFKTPPLRHRSSASTCDVFAPPEQSDETEEEEEGEECVSWVDSFETLLFAVPNFQRSYMASLRRLAAERDHCYENGLNYVEVEEHFMQLLDEAVQAAEAGTSPRAAIALPRAGDG